MTASDQKLATLDWILILDDEPDLVSVMKQGLQRQGFHVTGFFDPLQALEHFQSYPTYYRLVISDCRMPGMNGYEFISRVKKIKPEVIVILMTAFEIDDMEFKNILPEANIDAFVRKPVSVKYLAKIGKGLIRNETNPSSPPERVQAG